jgi:methylenetetrahydrofolate dehydrogenase (NADP+) / methenyltetrahydrofolate cyclohydrolase
MSTGGDARGALAGRRPRQARLLQGGPIATEIRASVAAEIVELKERLGFAPALAIVLVGKDAPSAVYLQQILRSCRNAGIAGRLVEVEADICPDHVRRDIERLNADPTVAGIIIQQPLPPEVPLRTVIDAIDPAKDIDGIHPVNAGLLSLGYDGFLPATAHAAVELLRRSGIDIAGRHAVVVGRSNIVGKPAALLLLREHATVTICHSKTLDLRRELRRADIVVVAMGKPAFVTGDMLKRDAVVIDVGINVVGDQLVGDVDFESARRVVRAISPVPGGVGPVTNAILLTHLVRAARTLQPLAQPVLQGEAP